MRKHAIEIPGQRFVPQAAILRERQQQKQRQASRQRQRQRHAVVLVQAPERRRPGVVGIGLHAHPGHRLRHVDREFMRRRVLTGVQAGAAVVAQICQIIDVRLAEFEPPCHRREHRAKAFAVAAGIADLHLAGYFGLGRAWRHGADRRFAGLRVKRLHALFLESPPQPPGCRRCARRRCRWSCRRRRCSLCRARCRP